MIASFVLWFDHEWTQILANIDKNKSAAGAKKEVAVWVLTRAIGIAMMDECITNDEDTALKAIYTALESKAKV